MIKTFAFLCMLLLSSAAMAFSAAGHGGGGHSSGHSSSHSSSHASSHYSSHPIIALGFVHGSSSSSSTSPDRNRLANCEVIDKDNMCAKYNPPKESYGGVIFLAVSLILAAVGIGAAVAYSSV